MTKHYLRLFLLAVATVGATLDARAQATASASTDRTNLTVGETLRFRLEIVGDIPPLHALEPPSGSGLALVQDAPTFRYRSRVRGRGSLTLEWTYRAERAGPARLESMAIPLGNQVARTDPIEIRITAVGTPVAPPTPAPIHPPAAAKSDLFIRAEPSRRNAFAGEQVIVTYVLYFDAGLSPRETELVGPWDAPGFWREELEIPYEEMAPRSVTIDGEPYGAVAIRRLALFPTRSGSLTLPAMTFRVRLARPRSSFDPFGDIFGSLGWDEEDITAPETSIRSTAPPPGAPPGFNGAVGHFTINSSLSPTSVETGEPVQLKITIRGTGNIATLEAPTIALPPSFERFGPAEKREISRTARLVSGSKSFETTLVPTKPGMYQISPISWSYYDPDQQSYKTLTTPPYDVDVTGAPLASAAEESALRTRPRPLMDERYGASPFQVAPALLFVLLLGGLLLPPLIALGTTGARQLRVHRQRESPSRRKRTALRRAQRALRSIPSSAARRDEADRIQEILGQLLEDRTGRTLQPFSRRSLARTFEGTISDSTRQEVDLLLSDCEQIGFAPGGARVSGLTDRARRLLKSIAKET